MIREEIFNGEVVQTTSPFVSEQEVIANASFGKYDYDPGARAMMMDRYTNPPPSGIGMPPSGMGNPLLQQTQYVPEEENIRSFIKPVNFGGEYLPPPDWENQVNRKILHYMDRYDEQEMMRQGQYNNGYYGMSNYYGTPYYSPYNNFNPIDNEINREVEAMKKEARENRIAFNKILSRTAHKFSNEDANEISEQEIDNRYRGIYIDTPGYSGMTTTDLSHQQMLANQQPCSNAEMYRAYNKAVSDEYHKIIPESADLVETFGKSALLKAEWDLEEERHRRNNASGLYSSNDGTYRAFVKAKAAARYKNQNNVVQQSQGPIIPNTYPTLKNCAQIMEDGTVNISCTCNFGSHKGEKYTIDGSQEAEEERKYMEFLNAIPDATSVVDPNAANKQVIV